MAPPVLVFLLSFLYSKPTLAIGGEGEGAGGPKSYDSTETRVLYKLYITMLTCMSFLNVNTLKYNKKGNKIQNDWNGNGKLDKID